MTSFLDFYMGHCRRQTDGGGSAAAAAAAAEAATQALVVAIFCWGAEGGPRAETILVVQDPRADRWPGVAKTKATTIPPEGVAPLCRIRPHSGHQLIYLIG